MSLIVKSRPPAPRRDLSSYGPWTNGTTVPTPGQDYETYGQAAALRVNAVVACVGLRAGAFAQLPLKNYRDDDQGYARLVSPQPDLFVSPSDVVVPSVWKIQMSMSRDVWGFALGRVTAWDAAMYPKRAEWICPDVVRPKSIEGGRIEWRVGGNVVDASDYLHVPSRWVPPGQPWGVSPLDSSGLVDLARTVQAFGRDWFRNGAVPSAIIYSDQVLDDEQQTSLLDKLMMRWRSRRPAVLGSGLKYEQVSVAANESQFLETITHVTADIAVAFNMPPTMVGAAISGSAVTYQNLEQNQQNYLVSCINPDLVVIQESLDRHTRRGQYSRWTTAAFVQSDTLTKYRAAEIGIRSKMILPDEARAWFEMAPLPKGMGQSFPASSQPAAGDVNANPDGMAEEALA